MLDPPIVDSEPDTVGLAVGKRSVIVCPSTLSLTDAADLLIEANHTAALVVDISGAVLGVLTENDFLAAFAEGVSRDATVARWLRGDYARLPRSKLELLTVEDSTPISEATAQMRLQRDRDGFHACHHLLVRRRDGGISGIVSAMDIARALVVLGPDARRSVVRDVIALCFCSVPTLAEELVNDVTVVSAMKKRQDLAECSADTPLELAFRQMFGSKQNCVLVVDNNDDSPGKDFKRVLGVITPRDLLHAFAGHLPNDTTSGGWLQETKSSERYLEMRTIAPSVGLLEAAHIMARSNMHHLIVAESFEIQGILSCLDLVCSIA